MFGSLVRYEVLQVVISEANIAVSGARLPVDIMSTKWLVLRLSSTVRWCHASALSWT